MAVGDFMQDAVNAARTAIGDGLRDTLSTTRPTAATPPTTPLGTLPVPGIVGGDGRGGIVGATATGGNTDNKGGDIPGYNAFLTGIPCRWLPVVQKTGPMIIGQRVTNRASWLVKVPWGTDIKTNDLIYYTGTTHNNIPHTCRVKDIEDRTDQLTLSFLVEEFT